MTAVVCGAWAGFQEFLLAPFGLWSMHKQIVARQTVEHVPSAPLHDQALRRLQLQAATPSRHGEFTSRRQRSPLLTTTPTAKRKTVCGDQGLYSSLEDLKLAAEGGTGDLQNSAQQQHLALQSSRSDGIFRLLSYIWFYNMLLVFVMGLAFHALSIIANCSFGLWLSSLWIVSIPCHLIIIILQNFIFLVMELVNVIYLKKICDRIGLIQSKRSTSSHGSRKRVGRENPVEATDYLGRTVSSSRESSPAPASSCVLGDAHSDPLARKPALYGIGKSLMDRVYSLLFFIIYRLQWKLVGALVPLTWFNFFINSTSQAFMYACYAYEYFARQTSDATIDLLLPQIVDYWPFFLGYGLPLGTLVSLFPGLFGWGDLIIAFTYPLLVIGAFQVSWSRALDVRCRVPTFTKSLLIASMRPSLWITNCLLSLFGRLGLRFCLARPPKSTSTAASAAPQTSRPLPYPRTVKPASQRSQCRLVAPTAGSRPPKHF
ncbi:hypothetical protein AAHC03_05294 [Spirometra sp. Aus1]